MPKVPIKISKYINIQINERNDLLEKPNMQRITYVFPSPNFHQSGSYHLWLLDFILNKMIFSIIIQYNTTTIFFLKTHDSEKTSPDFIHPIYTRGLSQCVDSIPPNASIEEINVHLIFHSSTFLIQRQIESTHRH